jgi:FkbM family methyltransferase
MTESGLALPVPRRAGLKSLLREWRLRLALTLLGRGAGAREALAEHLRCGSAYKGPLLRTRTRTLVACGDHLMWVLNRDAGVGQGLIKHGSWQREDFDTALRLILERNGSIGPVFVDVGANIGTQSVYAALSARFSRIVAIEPEPCNAALIGDNARLNDISIPFDIIRKAAGGHPGAAHLAVHDTDAGMHALASAPGPRTIEVALDTLPNILGGLSIMTEDVGLLWMDIEGREFDVFGAAGQLLQRRTPLFFEYSRAALGDQHAKWAETFRSHGYSCWLVRHHGRAVETGIGDALQIDFGNILLI